MSIPWDPSLETGHAEIDDQHRRIVAHCNRLHEAIAAGKDKQCTDDIVYFLRAYLERHFALEESLMESRNLADRARHRTEHRALAGQIHELTRRYGRGEQGLAKVLVEFLDTYFVRHIMTEDLALAKALREPEP